MTPHPMQVTEIPGRVRWVSTKGRYGQPGRILLQQEFTITTIINDEVIRTRSEWRNVPDIKKEDAE